MGIKLDMPGLLLEAANQIMILRHDPKWPISRKWLERGVEACRVLLDAGDYNFVPSGDEHTARVYELRKTIRSREVLCTFPWLEAKREDMLKAKTILEKLLYGDYTEEDLAFTQDCLSSISDNLSLPARADGTYQVISRIIREARKQGGDNAKLEAFEKIAQWIGPLDDL